MQELDSKYWSFSIVYLAKKWNWVNTTRDTIFSDTTEDMIRRQEEVGTSKKKEDGEIELCQDDEESAR